MNVAALAFHQIEHDVVSFTHHFCMWRAVKEQCENCSLVHEIRSLASRPAVLRQTKSIESFSMTNDWRTLDGSPRCPVHPLKRIASPIKRHAYRLAKITSVKFSGETQFISVRIRPGRSRARNGRVIASPYRPPTVCTLRRCVSSAAGTASHGRDFGLS